MKLEQLVELIDNKYLVDLVQASSGEWSLCLVPRDAPSMLSRDRLTLKASGDNLGDVCSEVAEVFKCVGSKEPLNGT